MNTPSLPLRVSELLQILGVILFCYCAAEFSDLSLIGPFVPVPLSTLLRNTFEHHFWLFIVGFIAIGYVSRGHLWSFGINSKNLKISMVWLGGFYAAAVVITSFFLALKVTFEPPLVAWSGATTADTIMTMLIYWMSSPVANQILFFGFAQTMMYKSLGYDRRIGPLPIAVLLPALLFTSLACDSSFSIGTLSVIPTFLLGLFSGIVYWKTGSLITPMLGQAFFFGFPVFVHFFTNSL